MTKIQLCERFGWTFAQIDAMDYAEYQCVLHVLDGMSKAQDVAQWRASLPPLGSK